MEKKKKNNEKEIYVLDIYIYIKDHISDFRTIFFLTLLFKQPNLFYGDAKMTGKTPILHRFQSFSCDCNYRSFLMPDRADRFRVSERQVGRLATGKSDYMQL